VKTVVVTGIGIVTPQGVGRAENVERLASGARPAEPPPADEAVALPTPLVRRVPDAFDPVRWIRRRKDLKLMARANTLAVAAARLALEDAGLAEADLADCGLFFGVGREQATFEDVIPALVRSRRDGRIDLALLMERGVTQLNPLSSLKTLPNMSVAHVSIVLGAMGPGQALCSGPASGAWALLEAAQAVAEGRASFALAGAADAPVGFADRVSIARVQQVEAVGEAAAVLVIETEERARARGARCFATIHPSSEGAFVEPALGECGAATAAASLALAAARGEAAAYAPVGLRPYVPDPPKAPALRLTRTPEAVAITGVGLVTPLGRDFATFTTALLSGKSGAAPISLFDARAFPTRVACEVPGAVELPEPFADAMAGLEDRKGELAIAAALAALADHGGLDPHGGIAYGTGLSCLTVTEMEQDCLPFLRDDESFDFTAFRDAPRHGRVQAPWRHLVDRPMDLVAARLGLTGPRAGHFSACAAGAAAVAHACDLIRRGEAPMMLAGAADSMIHPFGVLPFVLLGATTTQTDPDLAGRPFDKDRDGFVMGEGAAFFVLEPLSAARAAGRRVYGLVLGHGTSCDAHNVTAPHPEGAGAERAMRAALADAGLPASAVGYVNAHGTGTPLNDVIEAAAIARVFGARAAVSSSKGQVGHAIAAAGAVELAACLAAFAGGRLPPNAHLRTPDPRLEVDLVEREGRAAAPGVILSNSFGFGGQNACLLLGHPDGGRP
jgi:3-oxoacyl-(acyl-carrier-protein) synthase